MAKSLIVAFSGDVGHGRGLCCDSCWCGLETVCPTQRQVVSGCRILSWPAAPVAGEPAKAGRWRRCSELCAARSLRESKGER